MRMQAASKPLSLCDCSQKRLSRIFQFTRASFSGSDSHLTYSPSFSPARAAHGIQSLALLCSNTSAIDLFRSSATTRPSPTHACNRSRPQPARLSCLLSAAPSLNHRSAICSRHDGLSDSAGVIVENPLHRHLLWQSTIFCGRCTSCTSRSTMLLPKRRFRLIRLALHRRWESYQLLFGRIRMLERRWNLQTGRRRVLCASVMYRQGLGRSKMLGGVLVRFVFCVAFSLLL